MSGGGQTVKLLLHAARARAKGRGHHQKRLLEHRHGSRQEGTDWGGLGFAIMILVCVGLNATFAIVLSYFGVAAQRLDAEKSGRLLVSPWAFEQLAKYSKHAAEEAERRFASSGGRQQGKESASEAKIDSETRKREDEALRNFNYAIRDVARDMRRDLGGDSTEHESVVRHQFEKYGMPGFIAKSRDHAAQLEASIRTPLVRLAGLFVFAWWFVMLAFQGEGLEMDFQRRRHPMWEWLLTHPVHPGAVFLAEMLSPLAANPFFIGAPAFWIGLHWNLHSDFGPALVSGLLAGVPVALAACCTSKALEIATLLRLSPRSRGAMLGIFSWLGYASFILAIFALNGKGMINAAVHALQPLADLGSWPYFDWMLGIGMGDASPWKSVAICWVFSIAVIVAATAFSAWATNKGLAGGFDSTVNAPAVLSAETSRRWLRDPLYRKELLWFWRDRGALVQVVLIPITMAASQLFNFRGLLEHASDSWYVLCGGAVLFGTYFLFILGPRSLISEGAALWLPLTWPRGMEGLLKAKARLWWAVATVLVSVVLLYAALHFPGHAWKVLLVGIGWFLFSGSLAEKSVTLVTASTSSGEPEPVPRGRRWAASLGTFTFAIGIVTQRWSLAFVGIVYSWLTSAAMWQNFRARLPYLFDPWSERVPQPPTLMHAMISISAMTEGMAILFGIAVGVSGTEHLSVAQAFAYGTAGLITWMYVSNWMQGHGVSTSDIWQWPRGSPHFTRGESALPFAAWIDPSLSPANAFTAKLIFGAVCGAALGVVALGYSWIVMQFPTVSGEWIKSAQKLAEHPENRWWIALMAVGFAPLAEEYLFRGLLYRALDREWGGWRAMAGSALFFAIYHPPLAWIPVAGVGFFNAWLFKRSGHLMPCVLVHTAYNAVVVLF